MVIHNSLPHTRNERIPSRHLVALEPQRQASQRSVYTDPIRAVRLIKALFITAVSATTSTLAFTFGHDLLQFLGRAALVMLLAALLALVVALVIDTLKGPDA